MSNNAVETQPSPSLRRVATVRQEELTK
jgi:hypothetical protein